MSSKRRGVRRIATAFTIAAALAAPLAVAAPAAAQTNEAPVFDCAPGFYQVISGQLARLNPGGGNYEQIGSPSSNYNAIGYRIADGLLYGIRGKELLQIDAAGTVSVVATLPFDGRSYTSDFGDDGRLHVSRGGSDWHTIDVETGESTPMPGLSGDHGVADITNVYGVFYGVSSSGDLKRFDPVAQTVTTVAAVSGLPETPTSYGAAWSSAGGNLYVGRNTGEVFQITGYSGSSPVATQVATAPATNSNDGASCSLAPAPVGIVDVDGPVPETEPSTPEAQAAAEAHEQRELETFSFPSAGIADGPSCATGVDEDRMSRVAVNTQQVSTPTVIYTSGNSPSLGDFDVLSGLWSADGAGLEQAHTCGYDYTALLRSQPLDHFVWEATIDGVGSVNHGGLIVNQSSPLTRSGATIIDFADEGRVVRWGFYDDRGYYQMVGSAPVDSSRVGRPVTLTVEVHVAEIQVMVDGVLVTEFTSENGGGLVGLVTSRAAATFSDLQLTALPAVVTS